MANIDERLLAGNTLAPEQESDAARELKDRRGGGGEEADQAGEQKSLRQRIQAARQAMDLKAKAKKKIEEKVAAPAKAGTSNALRWAWLTLIPSFGLSLIYINLHVFLRYVFGEKLFCKLGEEWISKQISAVGGEAGKRAGKSIGIVEVMGLLMLDLLVLFLILIAAGVFFMLIDLVTGWFGWLVKLVS